MSLLNVQNLSVRFGSTTVVEQVGQRPRPRVEPRAKIARTQKSRSV